MTPSRSLMCASFFFFFCGSDACSNWPCSDVTNNINVSGLFLLAYFMSKSRLSSKLLDTSVNKSCFAHTQKLHDILACGIYTIASRKKTTNRK